MTTPRLPEKRGYPTPWRALAISVVAIFATETVVTFLEYFIPGMPELPEEVWALLDASLLVAITFPVLYFGFYRPAREHIAAQQAAEEALRAGEERLELIVETSPDLISALDPGGRLRFANAAHRTVLGYEPEVLIGQDMLLLVHPDDLSRAVDGMETVRNSPDAVPEANVFRLRGAAGDWVPLEMRALPLPGSAGLLVVSRDVSQRVAQEEALRAANEFRDLVMEHTSTGIAAFDVRGRFTLVNRRLCEVLDRGCEDLLGKPYRAAVDPAQHAWASEVFRRSSEGRPVAVEAARMLTGRGREVIVNIAATPLLVEGAVTGVVVTVEDVTGRALAEEAVRQSEALLRESQRVARLGSYEFDAVAGTWTSSALLDDLFGIGDGFSRDIEGWASLLAPDSRAAMVDYLRETVRQGRRFDREYRIVRHDNGEERWVHGLGDVQHDANGTPTRMVGTIQDITERRRAEEALHESQRERATLLGNLPGMAYRYRSDRNSSAEFVSDGCYALTGYSAAEFVAPGGVTFNSMVVPEDRDRTWEEVQRAIGRREPFELSYRIDTAWGEERWVWERGQGVFNDDGEMLALEGFIMDVTDRQRAEARLRESEERYRLLVEASPAAMVVTSAGGRIAYLNRALAQMLCVDDPQSLVGHALAELIHPDSWPLLERRTAELAQGATVLESVELTLVRQNGESFPAEAATVRTFFDGVPMTVSVARDLSDQRRAEEDRRAFERRLLESAKLESLGVLAGGVAHDFNNLLVTIMGNVSLSTAELAEESPARLYLKEIETAAVRAADLARQMLAYSGKGRVVVSQVDLSEIVREMGHLVGISVPSHVFLEWHLAEDLPPVEVDATQLRQVVMNLIINASEAIHDRDGSIRISTGVMHADPDYFATTFMAPDDLKEGNYVYCEVTDTGLGMDDETRARMFDPFFTTKFTGRGLGMAAVLGIVRGHRGAIRVVSKKGSGTTVRVLLPAAQAPVQVPVQVVVPAEAPPLRGTVLVVDDEEGIRMVTGRMLDRLGFDALTASDGQAALEVFREQHEDLVLVLLDLTMPQLGGVEVFEEMRATDGSVPVVVMSGFGPEEALGRFREHAPNGFLQKPFAIKDLEDAVGQAFSPGGLNEIAAIPYPEGERRPTMDKLTDGPLSIVLAGPVGFGNNIYVVIDRETGDAAFIDAPGDAVANLEAAEFGGVRPSKILLTHSHGDHTTAIEDLKKALGCKLFASAKEPWLKPGQIDVEVTHGDEVMVGNLAFKVIGVPGHTPGSVTFLYGKHAFVGDTIFPGGPGRSVSNVALHEEIASITNRLYPLPDDTVAYPGHGAQTTIGESRSEYAIFAAKEHDPNLHGDVSWLES